MQAVAAAELPPSMRPEIERERIGEFTSPSENTPEPQPRVARARGLSRGRVLQLCGGGLAAGVAGVGLGRWLLGDSGNHRVRVSSVQGTVSVRDRRADVLRRGQGAHRDDRFDEGAMAAAVSTYPDGTTVSLVGDSAVTVDKNGLRLHRGTANADIRPRAADADDLFLMTPLATLSTLSGVLLTLGLGAAGPRWKSRRGRWLCPTPRGLRWPLSARENCLPFARTGTTAASQPHAPADEFVLDLSRSLPDGWVVGRRDETADGVVLRPEPWPDPYYGGTVMHQIRSDHRWTRGFFRASEESVVHVRYRAERDLANGQMCFCVRTAKSQCSDTGMLHYNDGFKATAPGEWEWLHVRIADMLKNDQAPRFRTPMVAFLLILNTYTEDIGLEIAEFRVTPPGKKFEK